MKITQAFRFCEFLGNKLLKLVMEITRFFNLLDSLLSNQYAELLAWILEHVSEYNQKGMMIQGKLDADIPNHFFQVLIF